MSGAPIGRLMVIDDDMIDQMLYKRIIRRSTLVGNVLSFFYAQDALEYIGDPRNPPVDLILLDINMPRTTGLEFLEVATRRFGARFLDIPVVLLTSSLNPSDEQKAQEYDAVRGYFRKPFSPDHLQRLPELARADI